ASCPFQKIQYSCGMGILRVPKKFNILVEWASCAFPKNSMFLWNGHLARSQKIQYSCGMGILPVPIENIRENKKCKLLQFNSQKQKFHP
ncbi:MULTISPECIES: hypothetical protein, partial [unclassified Microcoleus]|uniref:hypothetical protein n=1 Tax=unclassified Microcoleus TaxID=2642155 RepID=UPI002FD215FE